MSEESRSEVRVIPKEKTKGAEAPISFSRKSSSGIGCKACLEQNHPCLNMPGGRDRKG